jgi:hypothetical protein
MTSTAVNPSKAQLGATLMHFLQQSADRHEIGMSLHAKYDRYPNVTERPSSNSLPTIQERPKLRKVRHHSHRYSVSPVLPL